MTRPCFGGAASQRASAAVITKTKRPRGETKRAAAAQYSSRPPRSSRRQCAFCECSDATAASGAKYGGEPVTMSNAPSSRPETPRRSASMSETRLPRPLAEMDLRTSAHETACASTSWSVAPGEFMRQRVPSPTEPMPLPRSNSLRACGAWSAARQLASLSSLEKRWPRFSWKTRHSGVSESNVSSAPSNPSTPSSTPAIIERRPRGPTGRGLDAL
mmetsp:Transcript_1335/g.4956  ORF Transcript_1335/g.4956 Transcript_1335/m.4956 type:complete len:216 (-) Transcript_1335:187-834(-)